jgi:hypothetical protein
MFASQLSNNQQAHSLRASQYRKVKKHRRGVQDESTSPEPEADTTSKTHSHASHASPEIAQLRLAGLSHDDEALIPALPFPHGTGVAKERYAPSQLQQEIAKSPIRLYTVDATSKHESVSKRSEATSLKKTHLNVLSAVMHRCLLDGDYDRAGRAWGMLLRTQVAGGRPVDPRNHERWGIGAELLLRRKPEVPQNDNPGQLPDQQTLGQDMFSEDGFQRAREYYERLVIQYPYRKLNENAVDERHFYPTMFSLWIFEVCEKSRRSRRSIQSTIQEPRSRSRSASMSVDSVQGQNPDKLCAHEDTTKVEELARATEIAERLDQLVASPPFDKQASLLQIRGDVSLWISALMMGNTDEEDDWDMDQTDQSLEDNSVIAAEQLTRLTNCNRELEKAEQFFERAEANGAPRRAATMASIDINLKELARQSAKLRVDRED